MKKLILMIIIIAVSLYNWNYLMEHRPGWFLRAMHKIPFLDYTISLDFNQQKPWTEQSLQDEFDNLFFKCVRETSEMGDRVCFAHITRFNETPANLIAFFFKNGNYQYLRVSSDSHNHTALKASIDKRYDFIGTSRGSTEQFGQPLGMWRASTGIISMFLDEPANSDETLVTWLRR